MAVNLVASAADRDMVLSMFLDSLFFLFLVWWVMVMVTVWCGVVWCGVVHGRELED